MSAVGSTNGAAEAPDVGQTEVRRAIKAIVLGALLGSLLAWLARGRGSREGSAG